MNNFNLIKEPAEEFDKLKGVIRKRIEEDMNDEALEIIQQTTMTCFEMKIEDVGKLAVDDLIVYLTDHRQLNLFEILMMAELFALEGEVLMHTKFLQASKNSYEKAEKIFEYLSSLTGETFPIAFQQAWSKIKLNIRQLNLMLK